MAFEISLPRSIHAGLLRWAGMVVDAYIERYMRTSIEGEPLPFEVELPFILSERPLNITVTMLHMGEVVRLRLAAPDSLIEQNIREYLERFSSENDGQAVVDRESKALWARIDAALAPAGLSVAQLHRGALLSRRAIESLIELAEDVARPEIAAITDLFANGPVEPRDRAFAVQWLLQMFTVNPDPHDRAQLSLRISENTVPAVAENIIQLIENPKYGESRFGLLMALAKTKHPGAADLIASVLHEKHLAWPGIEALAKLKATQHVDKIRPFLRDPNPDVRRQAKKALSKLGAPVAPAPKPIHLARKPRIPTDLTEWSLALDMDDVAPALQKMVAIIDDGFGPGEVAEVMSIVEEMAPDQTRAFRFQVTVGALCGDMWLVIFLDDVDSPDLAVHASPLVVDRFRSSVTGL